MPRKAANPDARPAFVFLTPNSVGSKFEATFAIVNSADAVSTYQLPDVSAELSVTYAGPSDWPLTISPATPAFTLSDAEKYIRKLREVHNALERAEAGYGPATTFGAYVQRVAFQLGAKMIGFAGDADTLVFVPLAAGATRIDAEVSAEQPARLERLAA